MDHSGKEVFPGLILCIVLSIAGLFILFGDALFHPNKYMFSSDGDGLKSYYCAQYHIRYDKDYWHTSAMNYPWGESVFYTDGQPLQANAIKLMKSAGIDLSGYTIGILNALLIISILAAAILLFAIFLELGIHPVLAGVWSVGVTFLSPQIDRLSGHFSLAYLFIIPLIIYLLIRYYKKPGLPLSLFIGLTVLLSGATHMYYIAFAGILLAAAVIAKLASSERSWKAWRSAGLHFCLQFILPVALLISFISFHDTFSNRTSHPYGFLYYKAFPESVFLPLRYWYGQIFHRISEFKYITWEGYSFIGSGATIVFLLVFSRKFILLLKGRFAEAFTISNNSILNSFFWLGIASLILACALPFRFGFDNLINYLGPLQQLRASGRFAWVFFYVMNIIAAYFIYGLYLNPSKLSYFIPSVKVQKILTKGVLIIFSILLLNDAWLMISSKKDAFKTPSAFFYASGNSKISTRDFQAILPLPYFHVGSENMWLEPKGDIMKSSFLFSLQTGLPSMAVMMGRTSITQMLKSIELTMKPYEYPGIMRDLPWKGNLLLLVSNNPNLNEQEKYLCEISNLVDSNSTYTLRELNYEILSDKLSHGNKKSFDTSSLKSYKINNEVCIYEGFPLISGNSESQGKRNDSTIISIEFWLSDISKDLMLTSSLQTQLTDAEDSDNRSQETQLFRTLRGIKGNWGYFEYVIKTRRSPSKLKVLLVNKSLDHEIKISTMNIRASKY